MALASACHQQDILCPGGAVRPVNVAFNWESAPQARVEGMTLYFFPKSPGGKVWRFDIPGRNGGTVDLPTGRYRMIAVNNDLPGITFSGQNSESTYTASARTEGGPTGMLYGGSVSDIDLSLCGVSYTTPEGTCKECPYNVVRCSPDSLATVYHIIVKKATGLEKTRGVTARLSGIASTMNLSSGIRGPVCCANTFSLNAPEDKTAYALTGETSGLGSPTDASPDFTLTVTATRTDGTKTSTDINVTQQVLNSRHPRCVYITVDSLSIPDTPNPPSSGDDVGLVVGVDGWTEITIDYDTSTP